MPLMDMTNVKTNPYAGLVADHEGDGTTIVLFQGNELFGGRAFKPTSANSASKIAATTRDKILDNFWYDEDNRLVTGATAVTRKGNTPLYIVNAEKVEAARFIQALRTVSSHPSILAFSPIKIKEIKEKIALDEDATLTPDQKRAMMLILMAFSPLATHGAKSLGSGMTAALMAGKFVPRTILQELLEFLGYATQACIVEQGARIKQNEGAIEILQQGFKGLQQGHESLRTEQAKQAKEASENAAAIAAPTAAADAAAAVAAAAVAAVADAQKKAAVVERTAADAADAAAAAVAAAAAAEKKAAHAEKKAAQVEGKLGSTNTMFGSIANASVACHDKATTALACHDSRLTKIEDKQAEAKRTVEAEQSIPVSTWYGIEAEVLEVTTPSPSDVTDYSLRLPIDATEPRLEPEDALWADAPDVNVAAVENALAGHGDSEIKAFNEVLEVKAHAAAEELLAEEEKEKQQAPANGKNGKANKKAKAKGKGKKGQGKRS